MKIPVRAAQKKQSVHQFDMPALFLQTKFLNMINYHLQEKLSLIRQLFQQQAAAATSSSSSGGSDTIKSGTSFKLNTANHTHSQIPQPQKLSLNKTIHLDIKKLC
jgi:hypothetical protein